jgi:hypothetical protein
LGGGLTVDDKTLDNISNISNFSTDINNQIKYMKDDILQLQTSIANSSQSVKTLENIIKHDIQNINDKIKNKSIELWKRVENKIDSNNTLLQEQVSDIMVTKLAMNNAENNISLLDRMEAIMQMHFDKMQDANNKTTSTLTTLSVNQDTNIQQLNTKIEKTTKQLTEMIDNVATTKGQRSGRYVT